MNTQEQLPTSYQVNYPSIPTPEEPAMLKDYQPDDLQEAIPDPENSSESDLHPKSAEPAQESYQQQKGRLESLSQKFNLGKRLQQIKNKLIDTVTTLTSQERPQLDEATQEALRQFEETAETVRQGQAQSLKTFDTDYKAARQALEENIKQASTVAEKKLAQTELTRLHNQARKDRASFTSPGISLQERARLVVRTMIRKGELLTATPQTVTETAERLKNPAHILEDYEKALLNSQEIIDEVNRVKTELTTLGHYRDLGILTREDTLANGGLEKAELTRKALETTGGLPPGQKLTALSPAQLHAAQVQEIRYYQQRGWIDASLTKIPYQEIYKARERLLNRP